MAEIKSNSIMQFSITLELTEVEARALEAIVGYGTKSFLEVFYKSLGKHYLQPHEKGVEQLFATIKQELPSHLNKIDECRKVFNK